MRRTEAKSASGTPRATEMRASGRASRACAAIQRTCASEKHSTPHRKSGEARDAFRTTRNQSPVPAARNPAAQIATEKLNELRGCEVHMTHIVTPGDEAGLRRLGCRFTSDPYFASNALFMAGQ